MLKKWVSVIFKFSLVFGIFFQSLTIELRAEQILYQPKSIGQDALFHPINFYLNTSFDVIQNPYYFSQKNFYPNHDRVFKRITNPVKEVERSGGFSKLLEDEFFGKRAFPNYAIHFLGEGSDYRRLAEWFEINGSSTNAAYTYAFFLSYAAQIGNEALESSNTRDIGANDHIADLFFFDWVGKLAFMNDKFSYFVRDELQLKTWSSQPFIDPSDLRVHNAALNYIVRPKIFGDESSIRPFLLMGMQVLAGASFKLSNERELSIAQGMAYTDPIRQKGKYSTGIFYDENGDLLTSLFLNSTEDMRLRLNVYPGMIHFSQFPTAKIGLATGWYDSSDWMLGVMVNMPFGIGFNGAPAY